MSKRHTLLLRRINEQGKQDTRYRNDGWPSPRPVRRISSRRLGELLQDALGIVGNDPQSEGGLSESPR
jgi:hypothetical protein